MSLLIIKEPYTVSFAGNPIAFTLAVSPYRAAEKKQDYKVIVSVEVEDEYQSNIFVQVKEMLLYPDGSGCVKTSIENILKSYLECYVPRLDQEVILSLTETGKRYQISYRLLKGAAVELSANTSSIYYVIAGGFSYGEWHPKRFFTQKLVREMPFLRFAAKKEFVFTDEYKYLSWLSTLDASTIQGLYVNIGYSDGTESGPQLVNTIQANEWQQCVTPAGFTQLNIIKMADAAKNIVWYEISVQSGRAVAWRVLASSAYCLVDGNGDNTGLQGWNSLEQYYTDDNSYAGVIKDNISSDPDYVAPVTNLSACPLPIVTRSTAWRVLASSAYCVTDDQSNNTGMQAWNTLEQYYTDNNTAVTPSVTKANDSVDPDYIAPVENLSACPLPSSGVIFGSTTFGSGDALTDNETANLTGGMPGATVTITCTTYDNPNGGTLFVNGSNITSTGGTFDITLDGSGNGSFSATITGSNTPPSGGSIIRGIFTITSVSSGSIGSNNSYQISKVFS